MNEFLSITIDFKVENHEILYTRFEENGIKTQSIVI